MRNLRGIGDAGRAKVEVAVLGNRRDITLSHLQSLASRAVPAMELMEAVN